MENEIVHAKPNKNWLFFDLNFFLTEEMENSIQTNEKRTNKFGQFQKNNKRI